MAGRDQWPHETSGETIAGSYAFVGIERNTKLVLCWLLGRRTTVGTQNLISRSRYARRSTEI